MSPTPHQCPRCKHKPATFFCRRPRGVRRFFSSHRVLPSVATLWETRGKKRRNPLGPNASPQKKVLSLVLCVAVMLSVMVLGAGAAFSDQADIENTEAVDATTALNIIGGYEDGSFHPERNIKRSEVTKMICVALNGGKEPNLSVPTTPTFTDVRDTADGWAEKYIESCVAQGIVSGVGGGRFSPTGNVTGSQLAKMLLVCLGYDSDIEKFTGNGWDTNVNVIATQKGIYEGLESMDVSAAVTRDQAAQMVWNALQAKEVKYEYTLVSENGQLVSKPTLEDKNTTLLQSSYDGASVYEGVLTASGEYGINGDLAGKDKIAMADVKKLNGANVPAEYDDQTWNYAEDVTGLVGQYVKVLVNNKGNAYGVFSVADENTVVTDIFANVEKDGSKIKVGDTSYNYNDVTVNGITGKKISTITNNVASGDQITFISNDGDSKFDLAIVNPMTAFGKVTYVGTDKVTVTGVSGSFDPAEDIIPSDLAKDDYVAVYKDLYTGNDKLVKADKVTGKVDATKGTAGAYTDVEIGGTWYVIGEDTTPEFTNMVLRKGDDVAKTGDTWTMYSINGVIYYGEEEAVGSNDTAYVINKSGSYDVNGDVQVKLLFPDNSQKVVGAKDNADLANVATGNLVTYEMDGNSYKLKKVDANNKVGGDTFVSGSTSGKFVKDDKKITIDSGSYRVASNAVVYIQYQETGSSDISYKAMTGSDLNNLGADFVAGSKTGNTFQSGDAVAIIDDGLATVVVLRSTKYLPGANASKLYGIVGSTPVERDDGSTKYREFDVYTNESGADAITVKVKDNSNDLKINKGDLISFDMTADNFIEGVLSESGTSSYKLNVGEGAIKNSAMNDYVAFYNNKDFAFDDNAKYLFVDSKDAKGVAADTNLPKAVETTTTGVYYNNAKYVLVDNESDTTDTTKDIAFLAVEMISDGWDGAKNTDSNAVKLGIPSGTVAYGSTDAFSIGLTADASLQASGSATVEVYDAITGGTKKTNLFTITGDTVSGRTATLSVAAKNSGTWTPAGTYYVEATYDGVTSARVAITVDKANPTLAIATNNAATSFKITGVTGLQKSDFEGKLTATGKVSGQENQALTITSVSLSGNDLTVTVSDTLEAGTVTVQYAGSSNVEAKANISGAITVA